MDVNLGKLAGKLTSGGSILSSVKDDKRNKVIPGTIDFLVCLNDGVHKLSI